MSFNWISENYHQLCDSTIQWPLKAHCCSEGRSTQFRVHENGGNWNVFCPRTLGQGLIWGVEEVGEAMCTWVCMWRCLFLVQMVCRPSSRNTLLVKSAQTRCMKTKVSMTWFHGAPHIYSLSHPTKALVSFLSQLCFPSQNTLNAFHTCCLCTCWKIIPP